MVSVSVLSGVRVMLVSDMRRDDRDDDAGYCVVMCQVGVAMTMVRVRCAMMSDRCRAGGCGRWRVYA